jgi:uncharacterized protein YqgV (UPF0045/DUF77 family)
MDVGVEISLYPLQESFAAPIREFIARVNADGTLRVVSNSMSTQIFGDYDRVMGCLQREMRASLENAQRAVFVLKLFGPLAG